MSTLNRMHVVQDLLAMRRPLVDLAGELVTFPIDCEPEQVQTLTRAQAVHYLDAFIDEELALDELEYWAMLVERRTDIVFEGDSPALREMVFVLAHPGVNRRLDNDRAQDWGYALAQEAAGS